MSRTMRLFIGIMIAAFALPAAAANGQWLSAKYTNQAGEREYRLYVPSTYQQGAALPLVVMLHGCTQNSEVFAESTGMNPLAEAERFLVLYPEQGLKNNPTRCWNWFLPENQRRASGEPSIIQGMIDQVKQQYAVNPSRIYVAGLSAGAAMSSILASCYPDVFAAAAIHDGVMYKAATSLTEAAKVMVSGKTEMAAEQRATEAWECNGRQQRLMPVIVFHGIGDNVINPDNANHIVTQFAQLNDLGDDGQSNSSIKAVPTSQESGTVEGGHSYTVSNFDYGGKRVIQYFRVNKMGHAWSGGKADLLFSDGKGPKASRLMWAFFESHDRQL